MWGALQDRDRLQGQRGRAHPAKLRVRSSGWKCPFRYHHRPLGKGGRALTVHTAGAWGADLH